MNIESDINFGPRLKKQRISRGISQAELSKTIGISASYLNLIESGKRKIPLSLLIKAAERLDISIKFLRMIGIKVLRNKNDIKIYGKPDLDLKKSFHIKYF